MDFIIEIIFRAFFIEIVGLYTRYYFFIIIGRKKSINYLLGKNMNEIQSGKQSLYNGLVGIPMGAIICFVGAYIVFGLILG